MTFPDHGFVLLALPKTASTTLERALAPYARLVISAPPARKHLPVRGFEREVMPQLAADGHPRESYEVVTMFREPIAWLESWWRYRAREGARPGRSTVGISFEEFALSYLAKDGAAPVPRGRPSRFISVGREVGVDRILAVERPEVWQAWFDRQIGRELDFGRSNASPSSARGELSEQTREALTAHFTPEYDVWQRLQGTGQWAGCRGVSLRHQP